MASEIVLPITKTTSPDTLISSTPHHQILTDFVRLSADASLYVSLAGTHLQQSSSQPR
jgi:hypothetical protein